MGFKESFIDTNRYLVYSQNQQAIYAADPDTAYEPESDSEISMASVFANPSETSVYISSTADYDEYDYWAAKLYRSNAVSVPIGYYIGILDENMTACSIAYSNTLGGDPTKTVELEVAEGWCQSQLEDYPYAFVAVTTSSN